jgi:hypothetical protein
MPPRLLCPLIVGFWVAMMAWLFQRDIWPRLAPGEPPAFYNSPADDVHRSGRIPTMWTARRTFPSGDTETYRIELTSRYDDKEHFYEYRAKMEPAGKRDSGQRVSKLISIYRVRDDRTLKEFDVGVELRKQPLVGQQDASFLGVVNGRVCNMEWKRRNDLSEQSDLEPITVSHRGVVLLPLHPLYMMKDVMPGQKWGVPAFDPLGHVEMGSPNPTSTWVNAQVRSEPVKRDWKRKDHECLVIDYEGEKNLRGSTWIDADDSRVLFMEVRLGDVRWEIQRD